MLIPERMLQLQVGETLGIAGANKSVSAVGKGTEAECWETNGKKVVIVKRNNSNKGLEEEEPMISCRFLA